MVNARGLDCVEFMDRHGFLVLNGRTYADSPARYTFVNSNGKSVIDLALVSYDLIEFVKDSGILIFEENSGHIPYFVDLRINITNNNSVKPGKA